MRSFDWEGNDHDLRSEPPYSERLVCSVCDYKTTVCTLSTTMYGAKLPECKRG